MGKTNIHFNNNMNKKNHLEPELKLLEYSITFNETFLLKSEHQFKKINQAPMR